MKNKSFFWWKHALPLVLPAVFMLVLLPTGSAGLAFTAMVGCACIFAAVLLRPDLTARCLENRNFLVFLFLSIMITVFSEVYFFTSMAWLSALLTLLCIILVSVFIARPDLFAKRCACARMRLH